MTAPHSGPKKMRRADERRHKQTVAGCTVHIGPANMPASPASRQPTPNTLLSSIGRLTPSRPTLSGSREPARRKRPNGVNSMKAQNALGSVKGGGGRQAGG